MTDLSNDDPNLEDFLAEIKSIEHRDSTLTPVAQIERLTAESSFKQSQNLNPFEVLNLPLEATESQIKKMYRMLSILVHPDKNKDNPNAQEAFEVVNGAYKMLTDPEQQSKITLIISEAKLMADDELKKRRKSQPLGEFASRVTVTASDTDESALDKITRAHVTNLFVELSRKKKEREIRESQAQKRLREEELEAEERRKKFIQAKKDFEDGREVRVDSWRNFKVKAKVAPSNSSSSSTTSNAGVGMLGAPAPFKIPNKGIRPPRLQPEERSAQAQRMGDADGNAAD